MGGRVVAQILLMLLFAIAAPLVNLDGDVLTVDTPAVVLADASEVTEACAETSVAASAGALAEAGRRWARGAVPSRIALIVAVKRRTILRRWRRTLGGGGLRR